ncbi:type IV toxin-antitoxin system AbiEi family antitoxin domain-containing protein [Aquihabitans daechungensis]|uniref:type IV toxin-antitoxin system AbiEi family antitoxin domain-containing protein n=1 Tax=Aquihabitans daechungensis TaxID=1052257 RepID=UPI003BA241AE
MDHRTITAIARVQHGLITRAQAMDAGGTRRTIQALVDRGVWDRARAGVYVVGAAEATWARRVMAACLAGGDDVRASHRTALRLHGLVDRSGLIEVLTDGYRRVRLPGLYVHRTKHLVAEDMVVLDGIPATSLARSLIDVGGRQSETALGRWIDRAVLAGTLDLGSLARRTNELIMPGRERPVALMHAIAQRGDGHDPGRSVFEARVIAAMDRRGMPPLVRQHPVQRPDGRNAFIDLADPSVMLAVELDGWATHGIRSAFEPDRVRGNELLLLGWSLLRFTWPMSDDYICGTIDETIARLARRIA